MWAGFTFLTAGVNHLAHRRSWSMVPSPPVSSGSLTGLLTSLNAPRSRAVPCQRGHDKNRTNRATRVGAVMEKQPRLLCSRLLLGHRQVEVALNNSVLGWKDTDRSRKRSSGFSSLSGTGEWLRFCRDSTQSSFCVVSLNFRNTC